MPKQSAPTSIVERLREQEIEKCVQDLKASFERPRTTNLKATQAAPLPHTPDPTTIRHTIAQCPLPAAWRLWDIATYHRLTPAEQSLVVRTRSISLRRSLGLLPLQWEIAPDDGALAPMLPAESGQPAWRFQRGSPHHVHAERRVDEHVVHIDGAMAMKFGPGRFFLEVRIFVDGRFAGRSGCAGCSLGGGGCAFPAMARISPRRVIAVHRDPRRDVPELVGMKLLAELWET